MVSRGVVSIDVVLSDIDINQCDEQESPESDEGEGKGLGYASDNLMEFMGTHLCKKSTEVRVLFLERYKECKQRFSSGLYDWRLEIEVRVRELAW